MSTRNKYIRARGQVILYYKILVQEMSQGLKTPASWSRDAGVYEAAKRHGESGAPGPTRPPKKTPPRIPPRRIPRRKPPAEGRRGRGGRGERREDERHGGEGTASRRRESGTRPATREEPPVNRENRGRSVRRRHPEGDVRTRRSQNDGEPTGEKKNLRERGERRGCPRLRWQCGSRH
jgi:hypothetical protein